MEAFLTGVANPNQQAILVKLKLEVLSVINSFSNFQTQSEKCLHNYTDVTGFIPDVTRKLKVLVTCFRRRKFRIFQRNSKLILLLNLINLKC